MDETDPQPEENQPEPDPVDDETTPPADEDVPADDNTPADDEPAADDETPADTDETFEDQPEGYSPEPQDASSAIFEDLEEKIGAFKTFFESDTANYFEMVWIVMSGVASAVSFIGLWAAFEYFVQVLEL